jgi:hypothetical protein
MAFHWFVDIHGMATRRIKTCQPHIPHNHQLQRIARVFKTLFK